MVGLFLDAAWQVALVALLLGAGLPALFAVGVRSLAVAGEAQPAAARRPVLRVGAVLCFAAVIASVAVGITVILATGFGMQVSFEHIVPMIVEKK